MAPRRRHHHLVMAEMRALCVLHFRRQEILGRVFRSGHKFKCNTAVRPSRDQTAIPEIAKTFLAVFIIGQEPEVPIVEVIHSGKECLLGRALPAHRRSKNYAAQKQTQNGTENPVNWHGKNAYSVNDTVTGYEVFMVDATIIIAAWCASTTLPRAVHSALAQNDVDLEVIVVDDASPDDTFAQIQALASQDARVRPLCLPTNGGPSAARNAGLAAAQGRWVAILDADDAFTPTRLARLIALAEAKGADAIFDDFQPVEADGQPIGPTHLSPCGLTEPEPWDLEHFLAGCQAEPGHPSLGYLKPVLRLDFLRQAQIRYDETLRNGEDFHLIAALLAAGGKLWCSPEPGYLYTVARGSISNRLDPDHARMLGRADDAFLSRNRAQMSARAVDLMRRRMRRLRDLGTAETVLQSLRSGHPAMAAKALMRRPRAIGRLVLQSWEAARRRLA